MPVVKDGFGSTITDRYGNAIRTRTDDEIASTDRFGRPVVPRQNTQPFKMPKLGDFNPSRLRLQNAGLNKGGTAVANANLTKSPFGNRGGTTPVSVVASSGVIQSPYSGDDWRVKISLAPNSDIFYRSKEPGIMSRLSETGGAVFPYTPQMSITHAARYGEQKLTHSNYANYFYEGSDVSAINISGEFTVQTPDEGQYLLAVISFFRSCTKMFFGNTDQQPLAGNPPPIVVLSGYGKYYLPNVPCVMTSFQHTMPADVDYLEVSQTYQGEGGFSSSKEGLTRLPATSTLAVTLQPVYSRRMVHDTFNLDKFASGELLISGANSGGGFL